MRATSLSVLFVMVAFAGCSDKKPDPAATQTPEPQTAGRQEPAAAGQVAPPAGQSTPEASTVATQSPAATPQPVATPQPAPAPAQGPAGQAAPAASAQPAVKAATADKTALAPLLAVPADADTIAPEDVVDVVRRMQSSDAALVFPVDPKIPLSREMADVNDKIVRRAVIDAFERTADKKAAWYGAAHEFVVSVLEHVADESRLMPVPGLPRQLVESGERLVNRGCNDAVVLHLYARFRFQNGSQHDIVAAQEAAKRGVALLSQQGYSHDVTASAMLLYAEIAGRYPGWGPAAKEDYRSRAIPEIAAALAELEPGIRVSRSALARLTARLQNVLAGKEEPLLRAILDNPDIDPWLGTMLLARQHLRLGSQTRGKGPPGNANGEQSQTLNSHLRRARALLLTAWNLHPEAPEAATDLIGVNAAIDGVAGETPRFWFIQAVKAEFDHAEAYDRFRESLVPRRGAGSEALVAFGHECLATGRFETQVPRQVHAVVQTLKAVSPNWNDVFRIAGLYDDYTAMAQGYRDVAANDDERNLWDTYLFCAAWLSARYDEAGKMLQELGNRVVPAPFSEFRQSVQYARRHLIPAPAAGNPFERYRARPGFAASVQLGYRPESKELVLLGSPRDRGKPVVVTCDPATGQAHEEIFELPGWQAYGQLSPDGRWLILDAGRRAELWNLQTKLLECPLTAPGTFWARTFSLDGKLLAWSGSVAGASQTDVWNLSGEKPSAVTLPAQRSPVVGLAISPDGRLLTALSAAIQTGNQITAPAELVVWDLSSKEKTRTIPLPGFTPAISDGAQDGWMQVSPDGQIVALAGRSADGYGAIVFVDVASGKASQTLSGYSQTITKLQFSSSGEVLLAGVGDGAIHCLDARYGIEFSGLLGDAAVRIYGLCLTPANDFLFSSDTDGVVRSWPVVPDDFSSRIRFNLREFGFLMVAHDLHVGKGNRFLATCDDRAGVALWDAADQFRSAIRLPRTPGVAMTGMALSADEALLATIGGQSPGTVSEVLIWDLATPHIHRRLEGHKSIPRGVAFTPDGKTLATGDAMGEIILWNVDAGIPWKWGRAREHQGAVICLSISPDGRSMISGGADGSFKIWDLPIDPAIADKPLISRFSKPGPNFPVEKVRFARDGRSFLTTSCTTEIWDSATLKLRFAVPGIMAAYVGDGGRFITGGGEPLVGEARLWDAATGKELRRFPGAHAGYVTAICPSPDGKFLFTAGRDASYRCWDMETGAEIQDFSKFPIQDTTPDSAATKLFASQTPAVGPHRTAAQWVIDGGGSVEVVAGGKTIEVHKPARLPFGGLTVQSVNFASDQQPRDAGWTDELISRLAAVRPLKSLSVNAAGVKEDDIRRLKSAFPNCDVQARAIVAP